VGQVCAKEKTGSIRQVWERHLQADAAGPHFPGGSQYTLPHYIRFAQCMREKAKASFENCSTPALSWKAIKLNQLPCRLLQELNRSQPGRWHAVYVEKALWSHARDAQIADEAPPVRSGSE
jgi:hypothetical protein